MLMTPIKFDCCFDCSAYSNKYKIDTLFKEKLPSNTAWLHARDRMLLPVLQRMALASAGIMPTHWAALEQTLPSRESMRKKETDDNKRKIRLCLWHLCSMVRMTYDQYLGYDTQDCTFFDSFASIAHNALRLLSCRANDKIPIMPMRSPEALQLWFQIKLLKNEDHVLDTVYNTASRMQWRNERSMWMVRQPHSFPQLPTQN